MLGAHAEPPGTRSHRPVPKDVIDARVALEARRRLTHEEVGVAVIARGLGFDDAANFTKFFRRRTGVTPEQFRESYRA
ncbi:helix-turn-helix domain-containing protein [Gordonia effusa]|uniref:helix-turn-helix domain-containing protein n=1 Tax=Gordonia effusa TaxID=263908 RepID=UPI0035710F49